MAALQDAEKTIGDYKLRTDPMYIPPDDDYDQSSASYKFRQLLKIREELCLERKCFNNIVFRLRDKKRTLVTYVHEQMEVLSKIHCEIPPKERRYVVLVPVIDEDLEYPDVLMNVRNILAY